MTSEMDAMLNAVRRVQAEAAEMQREFERDPEAASQRAEALWRRVEQETDLTPEAQANMWELTAVCAMLGAAEAGDRATALGWITRARDVGGDGRQMSVPLAAGQVYVRFGMLAEAHDVLQIPLRAFGPTVFLSFDRSLLEAALHGSVSEDPSSSESSEVR